VIPGPPHPRFELVREPRLRAKWTFAHTHTHTHTHTYIYIYIYIYKIYIYTKRKRKRFSHAHTHRYKRTDVHAYTCSPSLSMWKMTKAYITRGSKYIIHSHISFCPAATLPRPCPLFSTLPLVRSLAHRPFPLTTLSPAASPGSPHRRRCRQRDLNEMTRRKDRTARQGKTGEGRARGRSGGYHRPSGGEGRRRTLRSS